MLKNVVRYRRTVIIQNLKNSFPEKNEAEIRKLAAEYYAHLSDLIVENVKALSISRKQIERRCPFEERSLQLFQELFQQKKNLISYMGHVGNWEWARLIMTIKSPYELRVVYRPLSNKYFDRFFLKLRSRFGAVPVAMDDAGRMVLRNVNPLHVTVFLADQSALPENAIWIRFLNRETSFFSGAERLARISNYTIVYSSVQKVKRGYYSVHVKTLADAPKNLPEAALTQKFADVLEQDILQAPFNWLWSHRRWKHVRGSEKH